MLTEPIRENNVQLRRWILDAWRVLKDSGYIFYETGCEDVFDQWIGTAFTSRDAVARVRGAGEWGVNYRLVRVRDSGRAEKRKKEVTVFLPPFRITFQKGTYRLQYLDAVRQFIEEARYRYFDFFAVVQEQGIRDIIITRAEREIDRGRDGTVTIPESLLADSIKDKDNEHRAVRTLWRSILPSSFFHEHPPMRKTVLRSRELFCAFAEGLREHAQAMSDDEVRTAVDTLLAPAAEGTLEHYLHELYWVWSERLLREYQHDVSPESAARRCFLHAVEMLSAQTIRDPQLQRIAAAVTTLMHRMPGPLFDGMIEPLGIIKAFVEAQKYPDAVREATFDALRKTIGTRGVEELLSLPDRFSSLPAGREIVIYIDEELKEQRGYELIRGIIKKETERFDSDISVVLQDLSARVPHSKEPELILAMQGTQVFGKNVFRFSHAFEEFSAELYIFRLFF